ncbi:hypothetical protein BKK52_00740 [Rodentibacter trehalosifermentans]|uniref:NTP pyrophosphohydrolase MazG-like domain-containing protein n=1 Tax=Rodentibacter trehalosifermentans TaxID=1908263 RepID=A0A1V3J663_9PAST|nr:MazG-like family protein [Rodentibacter trehalosifermentans]OOF50707.1 hypothetical protein BKK52_00740 [Rodentibacter trehalosifermentans]
MKELIKNIEQWAEDRNLINGSTPQKQMLKLMEEFGELCGGIAKNKPEVIKDSIGDCFVVLVILNTQYRRRAANPENDFHPNMLIPNWLYNSKHIDDAMMIALSHFSACYKGGWLPMDWDIHNSVEALQNIANLNGMDIQECVWHAYDQIKDRKGKMIDGVFVKEGDLEND